MHLILFAMLTYLVAQHTISAASLPRNAAYSLAGRTPLTARPLIFNQAKA